MSIKILTMPASSGKTTWVVNQALQAGLEGGNQPRVVLPSQLQVADFASRLAGAGGALGVKLGTVVDLAGEVLELGGAYPVLLPENVQLKSLQSLLRDLDLRYYQAILDKPGFVRSCLAIIRELKSGGISPAKFIEGVEKAQFGPRLVELGWIYASYLALQQREGWADRAGLTWLALDLLDQDPGHCATWGELYLDGFDDLSPVQYQLITRLAERTQGVILTLTGTPGGKERHLVHKRFIRMREMFAAAGFEQVQNGTRTPAAGFNPAGLLEKALFEDGWQPAGEAPEQIGMAAVPDREAEVRTALRWIRSKISLDGLHPNSTAVLARNLEPYRGMLSRIAEEYQLPIRLPGGLPLAENPLIAAIMKLSGLIAGGIEGLAWHAVLAIWRSPYFSFPTTGNAAGGSARVRHLRDISQLEEVVRWGRIIQGYQQWQEAFTVLAGLEVEADRDDRDFPALPRGDQAGQLWEKFSWFAAQLTPENWIDSRENHIRWLERLLGGLDPEQPGEDGLGVVAEVLKSQPAIAERDWRALAELNRIFKEQIWAESLLGSEQISFAAFSQELEEVISRTSYQPREGNESGLLCAGCTEARGLTFQAVAVLGLAEGEFPGIIKEDPFLRDEERAILKEESGLPLRLSVDSAEGEYFYEALTRATGSLLLTRPRIAENGALWKPSPYWEEVLRITGIKPALHTTRSQVPLALAASQAEFIESIAARGELWSGNQQVRDGKLQEKLAAVERTKDILRERMAPGGAPGSVYNGQLGQRAAQIAGRYPDDHVWSASRLESYQTCPFFYFIAYLLGLEKQDPPEEGLDPRQLGNIYHQILERLYLGLGQEYTIADVLEALPAAAEPVLRDAPTREGFRETAWWEHSQQEILEKLKLSLVRLEEIDPGFRFYAAEQRFGFRPGQEEPVAIEAGQKGSFRLRGFIDRVDRNSRGEIRVIDYKTSGKAGFDNRAVRDGKKLQLPLYALAAQHGLQLGQVKEGFYFHLLAAEPSSFKLSAYKEGPAQGPSAAMERAAENGWQAVAAIKRGHFVPQPPDSGCPDYCPAAGFCWQYRPRRW